MNSILRQRRAWLAVPLTLATIFTALLTWTLTTTSPAQAVANRRVCLYLSDTPGRTNVKDTSGGYVNVTSRTYVGVNYTKQKDCPKITNNAFKDKFRATFGADPISNVKQSLCENWLGEIKATGKLYKWASDSSFNLPASQRDVCTAMTKDILYKFSVIENSENYSVEPAKGDFVVKAYDSIWNYV